MERQYELTRDRLTDTMAHYSVNNACFAHFHSSLEIVYVLEGELEVQLEERCTLCGPGSLIVNSCYMLHRYATRTFSRVIVTVLPLDTLRSLRGRLLHSRFRESIVQAGDQEDLKALLKLMAESSSQPFVNRLGEALATLLLERIGLEEIPAGADSNLIRDILEYMEVHSREGITVSGTAEAFGYSTGRFSHLFTERVGMSFTRYLRFLRCQEASRLLEREQLSLEEVSARCGFTSLRSFHRIYREVIGHTPRKTD